MKIYNKKKTRWYRHYLLHTVAAELSHADFYEDVIYRYQIYILENYIL